MRLLTLAAMLTLSGLTGLGSTLASVAPESGTGQSADSLWADGASLLEEDRPEEAMARFLSAIEQNPRHAPSYVGLGHAYLAQDSLRAAEKAFRNALRKKKKYPPALNGLGLVSRQRPKELRRAVRYFKKAIAADRGYAEAYYNLAQTYQSTGHTRELSTYEKLVKAFPEHNDAWFQVGRLRREGIGSRYKDDEKAEAAFRAQLAANPDHMGARQYLGTLLKETGRTDEALELLQTVVDRPSSYQRRGLLEIAQVYQKRQEFDRAEEAFNAYIAALEGRERRLYYDLSLVTAGDELARFGQAPASEWQALSDRFWASRDPAPVTAANERRLEHYRRIAYAKENFGESSFPWDDRGETYVRLGDPDHISSSEDMRMETDPRVLAVKDRLVHQAGDAAKLLGLNQKMQQVYQDRNGRPDVGLEEDRGVAVILGVPVYPLPPLAVWEYWVYADVGRGIEAVFIQRNRSGPYEHVRPAEFQDMEFIDPMTGRPNPLVSLRRRSFGAQPQNNLSSKYAKIWQKMHPKTIIDRFVLRTPQVYRPDFATGPLDFYWDTARFGGGTGDRTLEVYWGIPVRELTYALDVEGGSTAHLKRGFALYDADNRQVHRSSKDMELFSKGGIDPTKMAFVPATDEVELAPGDYRLSMQILDTASGKSQVYNQSVTLEQPFGDSLGISDIQLAALIRPADGGPFLKGEVAVVPNPTRTYLVAQPVHIYYEIYGLSRDEFGATRYTVSYKVRSAEGRSVRANVLKALGRLLGHREDQGTIVIEYDHTGSSADERGYLELGMSSSEPGEHIVTVTVGDAITGHRASSSAVFHIR